MKRYLLTFLTITTMALTAMAQVGSFRKDLAIGGSAGVVLNRVSFDPSVSQKFHIGPEVGVSVRYTCEKYFAMICALQVEMNFAQKGWGETMEDKEHSFKRTMNYIDIPLLAHLGFGRERKGLQGFILLGPQFGFCVGDSKSYTGEWTDEYLSTLTVRTQQHDLQVKNKFEYGITGGAGIQYSHPKMGHLALDARYYFGLSNIFGDSKKDVFGRSANTSIYVKLTYFYDVIKTKTRNKIK